MKDDKEQDINEVVDLEENIDRSGTVGRDVDSRDHDHWRLDQRIWKRRFISLVLASFIIGTLGGIFGYSLMNDRIIKNGGSGSSSGSKTYYTTDEQSSVIDVVQKVSPAVVSITSTSSVQNFLDNHKLPKVLVPDS